MTHISNNRLRDVDFHHYTGVETLELELSAQPFKAGFRPLPT